MGNNWFQTLTPLSHSKFSTDRSKAVPPFFLWQFIFVCASVVSYKAFCSGRGWEWGCVFVLFINANKRCIIV